jgi:hypothetical protein
MTSMLQVKSVLHSDGFEGMGSIVEVVVFKNKVTLKQRELIKPITA